MCASSKAELSCPTLIKHCDQTETNQNWIMERKYPNLLFVTMHWLGHGPAIKPFVNCKSVMEIVLISWKIEQQMRRRKVSVSSTNPMFFTANYWFVKRLGIGKPAKKLFHKSFMKRVSFQLPISAYNFFEKEIWKQHATDWWLGMFTKYVFYIQRWPIIWSMVLFFCS